MCFFIGSIKLICGFKNNYFSNQLTGNLCTYTQTFGCVFVETCLSEACLNSKRSFDNENLIKFGLMIILLDKITFLEVDKDGEGRVYYNEYLPFKITNVKYLQECILFAIEVGKKCLKFV